jgi:prepilin peptidase CpaA
MDSNSGEAVDLAMGQLISSLEVLPLLVVLAAGALTAVTDVRSFRIPNYITFPLLIAGILFHTFAASGRGAPFALLGGAVGFACLFVFYVMGGVGAGDVKLTAAAGAWLGPIGILLLFLFAAIFLGLYSVAMTWWQGTLLTNMLKVRLMIKQGMTIAKYLGQDERVEEVVKHDDRRKRLVPFAVMVFAGVTTLVLFKFLGPS